MAPINTPPQPSAPTFRAILALAAPALLRAYIDPGSGSFLIQIAIATVLGGAVMARLWLVRIVGVFRRTPPDTGDSERPPSSNPGGAGTGADIEPD